MFQARLKDVDFRQFNFRKMVMGNTMLRIRKLTLLILLCVLILGSPGRGLADVAPPEPAYSSNPEPDEGSTNVRMLAETVVMKIDADSPTDEGLAYVTATFTMRNLGDQDEQMDVRFPLFFNGHDNCDFMPKYNDGPVIADFSALVDGLPVQSKITYETFTFDDYINEVTRDITLACWANFPVTFLIDRDVTIQVTYTAQPYDHNKYGYYIYSYIIATGAGWKDTIGTADIIVQMPYQLNQYNFIECRPAECEVSDTQVQWHYEDLEPDFWGISLSLLPPPEWLTILRERAITTNNPNDGEAWGRLGKAYKEAIMQLRGLRTDPGGIEMYQFSAEAYQKALALLPLDAEWHYGYAELLCHNAIWGYLWYADLLVTQGCIEQLKLALEINSQHERANALLEDVATIFAEWHRLQIVDLSGSQPDYLVLTPQSIVVNGISASATANHITPTRVTRTPSLTPTLRNTVAFNRTQSASMHGRVTATPSAAPVITQGISSPTPVPIIAESPAPSQPAETQSPSPALWIAIGIAVVTVLGLGLMRMVKK